MKHVKKIIASTLIFGGLVGTTVIAHADKSHKTGDALAINTASIQMDKAVNIALAAVSGKATEAEFEIEDGKSIWEIEILDAEQQMHKVEIDANSGVVLGQELDNDSDDKRKRKSKRHHKKHKQG